MPYLKRLKILTIQDQVFVNSVKLYYRIEHDLCAKPLVNLFGNNVHNYTLRNKRLHSVNFKSTVANKSFLCKIISNWQKVPKHIKKSESLKSFNVKIKNYCIKSY